MECGRVSWFRKLSGQTETLNVIKIESPILEFVAYFNTVDTANLQVLDPYEKTVICDEAR